MRHRRQRWLLPVAVLLVGVGMAGVRSEHAQPNDWVLLAVGVAGTAWYGLSWWRDQRGQ